MTRTAALNEGTIRTIHLIKVGHRASVFSLTKE